MADIKLTKGDDTYKQTIAQARNYSNVFGLEGNDTFIAYNGTFIGGAGNDTFEQILSDQDTWMHIEPAYWDSPKGVLIDLQSGYANDGYGFRDVLIGIDRAGGSGNDDVMIGNAHDNFFWGNGGIDTIHGGLGSDGVGLNWFQPASGQPWRQALLSDVTVTVSVDGRKATIKPTVGSGLSYDLIDVEYFFAPTVVGGSFLNYFLADFISPVQQAQEAIAAGANFRWNSDAAIGSSVKLTFSFITTTPASGAGVNGFRALNASEQNLVEEILSKTSQICGLEFTQVQELAGKTGQLRFGISDQAQTKGFTWMPGQANAGDLAGDVWMDIDSMLGIKIGSEGYEALVHEIGHALGLRHPTNSGSGDKWATQLRTQNDVTALSVMSGSSSADGLFRADWGPLDILALRYLYGAKTFNGSNTLYKLSESQSQSQTSMVDDGGIDTLDASSFSFGAYLDLNPGKLSSLGLTSSGEAAVNNLAITAGTWIENVIGTANDDVLIGNDLNNRMAGLQGNDLMDGGKGYDTAIFSGASENYNFSFEYDNIYVAANNGTSGFVSLANMESLEFDNKTVFIASQAHASYSDLPTELYQFFITAFNAAPGVTYMDQLAEAYRYGLSVKKIVDIFTTKTQFTDVYPANLSHKDMATQLVNNIVKESASASLKTEAIADIKGALDLGWSVGDVIYTVFGNLAHKPLTDISWGNTVKQFNNEIAVAKYYTEVLNQSTTDLETLRDAIQPVTQLTDVSSDAIVAHLIGVALLTGGMGS